MSIQTFFHHIWLLDEESGIPLLSRSYSGLKFNDTIFSGLLLGIVHLMRESTGRNIQHFVLEDLKIHLRSSNKIIIAIICDTDSPDIIDKLTTLIGINFIDRYREELLERTKDIELFKEFEAAIEEAVTSTGMDLPTKIADKALFAVEVPTLSRESIEEYVSGAAIRGELQSALQTLREHPVFRKSDECQDEVEVIKKTKEVITHQKTEDRQKPKISLESLVQEGKGGMVERICPICGYAMKEQKT